MADATNVKGLQRMEIPRAHVIFQREGNEGTPRAQVVEKIVYTEAHTLNKKQALDLVEAASIPGIFFEQELHEGRIMGATPPGDRPGSGWTIPQNSVETWIPMALRLIEAGKAVDAAELEASKLRGGK